MALAQTPPVPVLPRQTAGDRALWMVLEGKLPARILTPPTAAGLASGMASGQTPPVPVLPRQAAGDRALQMASEEKFPPRVLAPPTAAGLAPGMASGQTPPAPILPRPERKVSGPRPPAYLVRLLPEGNPMSFRRGSAGFGWQGRPSCIRARHAPHRTGKGRPRDHVARQV